MAAAGGRLPTIPVQPISFNDEVEGVARCQDDEIIGTFFDVRASYIDDRVAVTYASRLII